MAPTPSRLSDPSTRASDVVGTTVQSTDTFAGALIEGAHPELRGNYDLVRKGLERLAGQLLVGEGPVVLGGIEEGDAALHGRTDQPASRARDEEAHP